MTFSPKKNGVIVGSFLILASLLFATSCLFESKMFSLSEPNPIHDFENDLSFFMQVGCSLENGGKITCPNPSAMTSSGCSDFHVASSYLGGLAPSYPIIEC